MKRIKIEVILLILFALLFAGCGGEREKASLTREEAFRALREVSPADGAFVTGESAVVHWATPIPATGTVQYRRKGESRWETVGTGPGTTHGAVVEGLRPGEAYEYIVSLNVSDGIVKSEIRSFGTAKGVSFTERRYQFTIERDYEQWRVIDVRNNDAVPHKLKATLKGHFGDLALGFVGDGSQDRIIELGAGESQALEFVIHAQDSKKRDYEFVIDVASVNTNAEPPVGDSATVSIHVNSVNFHLEIAKDAICPWTLSTTLKITNKGDHLTDFDIKTDAALAGKVRFHPQVQHEWFAKGQTMDVLAIPILRLETQMLSGDVIFSAAGKEKRFPITFSVPGGKAVYCAATHSTFSAQGASSSCTNAGHICDDLMIPGNGPASPPVPRPDPGEKGPDRKKGINPLDIFNGLNWDSEVADADITFSDLRKDALKDLYTGLDRIGASSGTPYAPASGNKVSPKNWDSVDNPLHVNMGKLAAVIKEMQMSGISSNLLDSCWSIHFDITKTLVGDFKQSWIRQKYMMDNQDKKLDIEMRTQDYNKTIDAVNSIFRALNRLLGEDDVKFLEFEGDISPDDFPTPGIPYGILDCVSSPSVTRYETLELKYKGQTPGKPWKGLMNAEDFRQIEKQFNEDTELFDNKNYLDYLKNFIKKIARHFDNPLGPTICPGIRGGAVRPQVALLQRGLESCNMREPFLLMGRDNSAALAWHSPMPGDQEIYFAKTLPGDELKVTRMSKSRGDSRWPYLAGNLKGNLYIAWEDARDGAGMEIYLKRSEDGGESWSEDARLTKHGEGAHDPVIWVSGSDLLIAWEDARGGIYRRISSDGGKTWAKESRIIEGRVSWPQIAGKENNLWMAWKRYEDNNETVYASKSTNKGKSWSSPFKLSGSSNSAGEPAIIVLYDGSVCAAWRDNRDGASDIYFRKSKNGRTWTEEARLTTDTVYSEYPSMAETGKGLLVTFFSPSKGINFRCIMESSDMGKTWKEPFRISALKPNVEKAYFCTNFKLPWPRKLYPNHDIRIKINGHTIASFKDTVPAEGQYIFEFDPGILNYNPGSVARNWIEYDTTHLRGGHFYVTSNHKIILSHTYQEMLLVASSQAEADRAAQDLFPEQVNHALPDIGIYANKVTGFPEGDAGPQKVNLEVEVMNIGAGEARDIEVYIAKGADGNGEKLGSPARIPSIAAKGMHTVNFDFDYDGSCFMAAVIARCKDADYDSKNNRSVFRFGYSDLGKLLVVAEGPRESSAFVRSGGKKVKTFTSNEPVELPIGVYKIVVHGKEDITRENVAIKEGGQTLVIISAEDKRDTILRDTEGKGELSIDAANVYDAVLYDAEGNEICTVKTGYPDLYTRLIPIGTYAVKVRPEPYPEITLTVTIREGELTRVRLPGYGSIDLVAQGWYDAELFDAEGNKVRDLITWNTYVVPEGIYTLRVEGKEFKNIVVKVNETTAVETGL